MKIYCILFDTVPQHPKIEELFKSKNLHYADYITNSSTVPTLISMFSGKTPTEMAGYGGVGHSHTYSRFVTEKDVWDSNMILHQLPNFQYGKPVKESEWKIHIHAMPKTRGDGRYSKQQILEFLNGPDNYKPSKGYFRLMPDDICGRNERMIFHQYTPGWDEENFMKKMQNLPNNDNENYFIVLKYNHYHDNERGSGIDYKGKRINLDLDKVVDMFADIINDIDFEEEDSLFWLFADHGEPGGIDKLMSPPHSWLAWCSVTDNITYKKVTKNTIAATDFKNTVLNRIYNHNGIPDWAAQSWYENYEINDVLAPLDKNRIYVCEDGRGNVDPDYASTVSAIKKIDENRYKQFAHHAPHAASYHKHIADESRTIIYDKRTQSYSKTQLSAELTDYLGAGPWNWYFTDE